MTVSRTLLGAAIAAALLLTGCATTDQGQSSPDTKAVAPVAATSVNSTCPIMGGDVDPEVEMATYGDMKIGFCCGGCDEKWEAWSDQEKAEFVAAAMAEPVMSAAMPVNAECPIMGGDVDPEAEMATYGDAVIGFCCEGCKDKWEAWPDEKKTEFIANAR